MDNQSEIDDAYPVSRVQLTQAMPIFLRSRVTRIEEVSTTARVSRHNNIDELVHFSEIAGFIPCGSVTIRFVEVEHTDEGKEVPHTTVYQWRADLSLSRTEINAYLRALNRPEFGDVDAANAVISTAVERFMWPFTPLEVGTHAIDSALVAATILPQVARQFDVNLEMCGYTRSRIRVLHMAFEAL